jgi:hypothetical protein
MTWGWTGRNTVPSKHLLKGPTTATKEMELKYLSTAAGKLTGGLANAALPFVANEHLADYKAAADAELHAEFANFLAGDNRSFLKEGSHTAVPFVTPFDPSLLHADVLNGSKPVQVLDRVQQQKIPWGNKHLLHIPGAHAFLTKDIIKRREFDAYIGALHYNGPQTMEQAWHYFKFIVKGAQPDAVDLEKLQWKPTKPLDPEDGLPASALKDRDASRNAQLNAEDDDADDDNGNGGGYGGGGGGGGGDDDDPGPPPRGDPADDGDDDSDYDGDDPGPSARQASSDAADRSSTPPPPPKRAESIQRNEEPPSPARSTASTAEPIAITVAEVFASMQGIKVGPKPPVAATRAQTAKAEAAKDRATTGAGSSKDALDLPTAVHAVDVTKLPPATPHKLVLRVNDDGETHTLLGMPALEPEQRGWSWPAFFGGDDDTTEDEDAYVLTEADTQRIAEWQQKVEEDGPLSEIYAYAIKQTEQGAGTEMRDFVRIIRGTELAYRTQADVWQQLMDTTDVGDDGRLVYTRAIELVNTANMQAAFELVQQWETAQNLPTSLIQAEGDIQGNMQELLHILRVEATRDKLVAAHAALAAEVSVLEKEYEQDVLEGKRLLEQAEANAVMVPKLAKAYQARSKTVVKSLRKFHEEKEELYPRVQAAKDAVLAFNKEHPPLQSSLTALILTSSFPDTDAARKILATRKRR